MNKKIFTILLLLAMVASVSAVSAFDLGDLFGSNNSEQVTIGGINFTIPDGYEEIESEFMNQTSKEFSKPGYHVEGKAFKNNATDVEIIVGNYTNITQLRENLNSTGNETTIAGIAGYSDEIDDTYLFSYEKDSCQVTFSTNDKNAIADFIIA